MDEIVGTWQVVRVDESEDALYKKLGFSSENVAKMKEFRPTYSFYVRGSKIWVSSKVNTPGESISNHYEYEIGKPKRTKSMFGNHAETVFDYKNGIWEETHKLDSGDVLRVNNVISGSTMNSIITLGDITCKTVLQKC